MAQNRSIRGDLESIKNLIDRSNTTLGRVYQAEIIRAAIKEKLSEEVTVIMRLKSVVIGCRNTSQLTHLKTQIDAVKGLIGGKKLIFQIKKQNR